MAVALFVAQIVGPLYLIVALGMLLNPGRYREMVRVFLDNQALIMLGGIMALVAGLVFLNLGIVWGMHWAVIIPILGWMAVLKGAILLIWPQPLLQLSSSWYSNNRAVRITALGALIFGGFLTFKGYG